jgi:hypothetical protein
VIKVFVAIPKRADISESAFHAHWREPHGRLALHIKPMRRYVQSHRITVPVLLWLTGPYDGFAEVWLDNLKTAVGLGEDPDYQRYLAPDEPNFCDVARLQFILTLEDVALSGPTITRHAPTFKVLQLVRRGATVSSQAFQKQWASDPEEESELVRALGAIRHVRCRVATGTEPASGTGYDAIRELWWSDLANFLAAQKREPLALQRLMEYPANTDPTATLMVPVEEHRVLWP